MSSYQLLLDGGILTATDWYIDHLRFSLQSSPNTTRNYAKTLAVRRGFIVFGFALIAAQP